MKLPLTMCLAWAGFSHMGRGRGRWYELRTSSADAIMPIDWASDGEFGRGGSLARPGTDRLAWGKLELELELAGAGACPCPSPSTGGGVGEVGLLFDAPLNRALLETKCACQSHGPCYDRREKIRQEEKPPMPAAGEHLPADRQSPSCQSSQTCQSQVAFRGTNSASFAPT